MMKIAGRWIVSLLLLLSLSGITALPETQATDAPWPMFRHDVRLGGTSTARVPANPVLKWTYETSAIFQSPVVGADGTIYLGDSEHWVYALNGDGSLRWKNPIEGTLSSASPALAPDGTIYVAMDDGLYAFQPDGSLKWRAAGGDSWCFSSPVVTYDGSIYVGWSDNKLFAFSPSGAKKWEFQTIGQITAAPAIAPDGSIYIISADGTLYAINPDGTLRWQPVSLSDGFLGSVAIASDGTLYIGALDKNLYALNPNGLILWRAPCGGRILHSSPAIAPDGTIYVGAEDYRLYAFNPDGSQKWSFPTGGVIDASPVVDGNGTVYIGSDDGQLYAVRPDGTPAWPTPIDFGEPIRHEVAIGSDGTLYVAGYHVFIAYGAAEPSPTPAPTPSPSPIVTRKLQFLIGEITYLVNGTQKTMDTAPVIAGGRTFLPIRYVAQELGATVSWMNTEQKVTVTLQGVGIELWIGKNTAAVDGVSTPIDPENPEIMPFIQPPGRTMLPLRFIAETLGCRVDWLPPKEVQIRYPAP